MGTGVNAGGPSGARNMNSFDPRTGGSYGRVNYLKIMDLNCIVGRNGYRADGGIGNDGGRVGG
jgi:hypothetical protein